MRKEVLVSNYDIFCIKLHIAEYYNLQGIKTKYGIAHMTSSGIYHS